MKVHELIRDLGNIWSEVDVVISGYEGGRWPIEGIYHDKDSNTAVIMVRGVIE